MPINKWKQFLNERMSTLHTDARTKLLELNGAKNADELAERLLTRFENLSPQEFISKNPSFVHAESIMGLHGEIDGIAMYHDGPTHDRTPSNGGPGWSRTIDPK